MYEISPRFIYRICFLTIALIVLAIIYKINVAKNKSAEKIGEKIENDPGEARRLSNSLETLIAELDCDYQKIHAPVENHTIS